MVFYICSDRSPAKQNQSQSHNIHMSKKRKKNREIINSLMKLIGRNIGKEGGNTKRTDTKRNKRTQ